MAALASPAADPAGAVASSPWAATMGRPFLVRGRLRRRRTWGADEADVLVQPGEQVHAGDAIARLRRGTRATVLDAAAVLGISAERVPPTLTRRVGDVVADGDVLAERRALAGLQRRVLRSPISGRLSYISAAHGTVYIEPAVAETPLLAHLSGEVVAVTAEGIVVEGHGLAIAGVAGAGRAAAGQLLLAESPTALPPDVAGAVVACAFPLLEATVRTLTDGGAAAVLAPGIADATLQRLGWDDLLWTAPVRLDRADRIGPRPAPPLTVVLLAANAGELPPAMWEILHSLAGRPASAIGAELGAAPEVIVHLDDALGEPSDVGEAPAGALLPGTEVRVLAGRAEGQWGEVAGPVRSPYRLASEIGADVVEVRLMDDTRLRVPLVHLQRID